MDGTRYTHLKLLRKYRAHILLSVARTALPWTLLSYVAEACCRIPNTIFVLAFKLQCFKAGQDMMS